MRGEQSLEATSAGIAASLQAALTDLGIDWKAGHSEVRGYRRQTTNADVAIAQDNG